MQQVLQSSLSFISSVWQWQQYYATAVLVFSVLFPLYVLAKAWIGGGSSSSKGDGKEVPGTLGLPYIGQSLSFVFARSGSHKGYYEFVRQMRKRNGIWFKTRLFGKTHVFVPTPEGAKFVFGNDWELFDRTYIKSTLAATGENSLFFVPRDAHARLARCFAGFFGMNSTHVFVKKIDAMIVDKLQKLADEGKSFTVLDFAYKLTFSAVCMMLLGDIEPELLSELEKNMNDITNMLYHFPVYLPGARYYKGLQARKRLSKIFLDLITKLRQNDAKSSTSKDDFCYLQKLLDRDELTEQEIIDNLITLMLAGQSSPSANLTWIIKYLSDHEHVQEKLRAETLELTKKKPEGEPLTMEDLNAMPYANNVVKETLRLASVVEWFPRTAKEDCVIDGYKIKKGWRVNVDATYIHHDPNNYDNPLQFNPSRFDGPQKPFTYMPFGGGPRPCSGYNMAKVTMLVFATRITGGYKWKLDDADARIMNNEFQAILKNGCPITLIPLHAS